MSDQIEVRSEKIRGAISKLIESGINANPSVVESVVWKAYSIVDAGKRVAFVPDDEEGISICLENNDKTYSTQIGTPLGQTFCNILNGEALDLSFEDVVEIGKVFALGRKPLVPPDKEQNYMALVINQLSTKLDLPKDDISKLIGELNLDDVVMRVGDLLHEKYPEDFPEMDDPIVMRRKLRAYDDLVKVTMSTCDIGMEQASKEILNALLSDPVRDRIVGEIKRSRGWH